MQNSLIEKHPKLFHYTNARGLTGILESQMLWATHYAYLNDSEEMMHFHKKKMPQLIKAALKEVFIGSYSEEKIDESVKKITDYFENIVWHKANENNALVEPYVTSFCSVKKDNEQIPKNGLLSQWRGYGKGGGYALVFDTERLLASLNEVKNQWEQNESGNLVINEVVYSSVPDEEFCKNFKDQIIAIKEFISDYIQDLSPTRFFQPYIECSCWYKHWGFEEENEIRIVAIPHPDKPSFNKRVKNRIPIKHHLRSTTLVPYISLFEENKSALPIEYIIVGPSPNEQEKKNRVRAVEILLQQYKLNNVGVIASEIPYIG